ncbi:MAG: hypothetical protein HY092_03565, partial [Candidatus Kerfeldbacteria bacterium]|nr:hypothetical protein [Candidatus Kerfeldbacteria bacterium]
MPGIRDHLQPLELLDLQKCDTVGKIVDGLSRCSFGGRMLGEVCATIEGWVRRGHHVSLVYDGHNDSPLAKLLYNLEVQWGFSLLNSSSLTQYNRSHGSIDKLIAVGHVDERYFNELCECDDIIFINGCGVAKLGQIRDGYFPNAIFADPMYVLPILNMVLEERVGEGFTTAKDLMWRLRTQGGLAQEVAHGYRTLKGMVD